MQLKLVDKKLEARDTYSFIFERPKDFNFQPGQYIYLTLQKLNYPDERGETRHFTISSSPTENFLQITTRIRSQSGYKKTLNEMEVGGYLEARGPFGVFCTPSKEHEASCVFIAGGIGITPFRSMIKYNIDSGLNIPVHLIYSNSDDDFIFKNELDKWQAENDFVKITYINTKEQGRINKEKLNSLTITSDRQSDTFWLVGSTGFVNDVEEMLSAIEINKDNIKSEKFTGY